MAKLLMKVLISVKSTPKIIYPRVNYPKNLLKRDAMVGIDKRKTSKTKREKDVKREKKDRNPSTPEKKTKLSSLLLIDFNLEFMAKMYMLRFYLPNLII